MPAVRTPAILATYWFAALAALGVFFPLFSLYLSENLGLRGYEIGFVTAAIPLTGLLAQPFWGALADRSGSRVRILALLTAGAAAGYTNLAQQDSFASVFFATLALALFSTSVTPMAVSVSLALLRERGRHAFGMVRSVGTLGYLVAVVGFPRLLHHLGEAAPVLGPAAASATDPPPGLNVWGTAAPQDT